MLNLSELAGKADDRNINRDPFPLTGNTIMEGCFDFPGRGRLHCSHRNQPMSLMGLRTKPDAKITISPQESF